MRFSRHGPGRNASGLDPLNEITRYVGCLPGMRSANVIRYVVASIVLVGAFTYTTVREYVRRDCTVTVTEAASRDESGNGTFTKEARTICK